ncbi:MAG: hypothetical protein JSU07_11155 [Bacteroidetes bacterium]|nr:hypothetical protein [Bacteroidota bacterium]
MLKSKFLIFAFATLASLVLTSGIIYKSIKIEKMHNISDSYDKLWKQVSDFEAKGLTESALTVVNEIYIKAKGENNSPQFIKALIFKIKYAQFKEENSTEKNINNLNKECLNSSGVLKSLLHSMLAQAYWNYYSQNRWKFYNRSETVNFDSNDVATYDLKKIINACINNYKASLINAQSLKEIKIEDFDLIINKNNKITRAWRPTLYHFLAHRAIDFFKNSEADVTKAASQFNFNADEYLLPYTKFIDYKIEAPSDSLELKYFAFRLMQDVYAYNIQIKNNDAILDMDLNRLNYVYNNAQNPNKDSLYFNSLKWLLKHFESNKRVAEIHFEMANWYFKQSISFNPHQSETEKYKHYKKTALQLCNEIIRNYPNSNGADLAFNLIETITQKEINIDAENYNDFNKNNLILLKYKNVEKVYFKIVKSNYFDQNNRIYEYDNDKATAKLNSLPTAITFDYNLPLDNDYNTHSVELKIPPLNVGHYYIIASLNSNFSNSKNIISFQKFNVTDLSCIYKRQENNTYNVYALNRNTGSFEANCAVQVWWLKYNYSKNRYDFVKGNYYTTNANGFVNIQGPGKETSYNYFIEIKKGNDSFFTNESLYEYYYPQNNARTITHLFTDRSIYRSGQTIYYKGIMLQYDADKTPKILSNTPAMVQFYDVNHQLVSEQKVVSNDYGTFNGTFIAPQGVLTGVMQIVVSDGGSVNISVEEYKRPKFETFFDTLKGNYKLNEAVTVKGIAKAFAGNMIDGASVKYRVVREINYPYWWYWYRPRYSKTSSVEITNGNVITNENGEYFIKFSALPDITALKTDNPIYTFKIIADVTDINGETQSAQTYFRVGYNRIELSTNLPETIITNNLPEVSIYAKNLNGIDEPAFGKATLIALNQPIKTFRSRLWDTPDKHQYSREEFYKLFPDDQYEEELNIYKWTKGNVIFTKNFDTKKDKNIIWNEFKNIKSGQYIFECYTKDADGVEVKSQNYITIFNPEEAKSPTQNAAWSFISNSIVEPGEKAKVYLTSAYQNVNVIYEIEKQKNTMLSFTTTTTKPFEIDVNESDRGGMQVNFAFIKKGRTYINSKYITVPYSNKELDVEFASFRNKLLPGQNEEWTLTIKNKKGDKVAAEMLASMYDASLDAIKPHGFNFNPYNTFYPKFSWEFYENQLSYATVLNSFSSNYKPTENYNYDELNWFGAYWWDNYYYGDDEAPAKHAVRSRASRMGSAKKDKDKLAPMEMKEKTETFTGNLSAPPPTAAGMAEKYLEESPSQADTQENTVVPTRKNFNETAFFYPELRTNDKGEILVKFTVPESLTKWKFMSLATTKDLCFGSTLKEIVTQKDLMLQPNPPRFFRENDKLIFISKIVNVSDKDLSGTAQIKIYDALTDKEITTQVLSGTPAALNFSVNKKLSTSVEWELTIPEAYQAIRYKITASASNFSDGEEMVLPVLTNRMLVTESMPLPIRGNQTKEFKFTKFISQNNNSNTLKNHAYTLEFTANPAWYAIQSLPYLIEYPYECNEQTFSRYYANSLASFIVNSKPKIKQIFDVWKQNSKESFMSNLEKNQELKSLLLEETPWVLQSKNESENKKRVGLLFDLNKMSSEMNSCIAKLKQAQTSSGSWPWFKGGPSDWYITQYIATGFAHLQKMNVIKKDDYVVNSMIQNAIKFCDYSIKKDFEEIKQSDKDYLKKNHLSYMHVQYLYMRSYFVKTNEIKSTYKEAFNYFKSQAQQYWLQNSRYMQGMIALALNRFEDVKTAHDILKSLKENSKNEDEMGMYWKENYAGYYWYQAPIETQALMIEAFDEISNDTKAVDDLKTWLIKSKQTQNWGTTKATAEAVYALLNRGTDWLSTEPNVEINLGNIKIDPKNDKDIFVEPGTGYFKKSYSGSDIKPEMGNVKVVKKDAGVSWGSVYWQYFEQLDKITQHETPLKLSKKLFIEKNTASGPVITPVTNTSKIKLGDKVVVRIELRTDRDMEYVHLKDMRASGFEPVSTLSAYHWQDGLGYYQSTRDASTNFFISYLRKGVYVFEYKLNAAQKGNFSNGISSIQCMYAPEFTAHSEGIKVVVEK